MSLKELPQLLIYFHALLGSVALVAGALALYVKKGSKRHFISGKVFFYSMLSSAITALIISVLPNHESPFLFAIGIFSSYFIVGGYRALKFKKRNVNLLFDKSISWIMILTGIAMITYPIIVSGVVNIVLTVFGTAGIVFSIRDLILYNNPQDLHKEYLKQHLGKMIGGYIAAVTAFLVVNQVLPPLVGWLGPGVVGGFFIAFWNNKLSKNNNRL